MFLIKVIGECMWKEIEIEVWSDDPILVSYEREIVAAEKRLMKKR